MKTIKILFLATLLFTMTTNAQITRGNWIAGGSGSFSSTTHKTTYLNERYEKLDKSKTLNELNISPNVGYFIIDKLVLGTSFNASFITQANDSYNDQNYSFGPFVRYYFLSSEKRLNILAQAAYSYNFDKNSFVQQKSNGYSFKAGPVVFLNSSVGVEFLVEYNSKKQPGFGVDSSETINKFQVGIGLQIHLKK